MPLNKPPLRLEPAPDSVQEARRWVVETCEQLDRGELAECAELAVSELVTNAILHGEPPLAVAVRGTREHPRIEVSDGSSRAPVMGGTGVFDLEAFDAVDADETLLTTLGRCPVAWGADVAADGKRVWFEPAAVPDPLGPTPGAIITAEDVEAAPALPDDAVVDVVLRGVPVLEYAGFRRHFSELRRELRLLSLAHESKYPLAKSLSDLLTDFEQQLVAGIGADRVEEAAPGSGVLDLPVRLPLDAPPFVVQMIELLELADAFCRAERLLSLERSPVQAAFQRWLLGELVRQGEGLEPVPWQDVAPDSFDQVDGADRRTADGDTDVQRRSNAERAERSARRGGGASGGSFGISGVTGATGLAGAVGPADGAGLGTGPRLGAASAIDGPDAPELAGHPDVLPE